MKSASQLKPVMMIIYMTVFTAGMGNISCSMGWEPGLLKGRGFTEKAGSSATKKVKIQVLSPLQAINSKFF